MEGAARKVQSGAPHVGGERWRCGSFSRAGPSCHPAATNAASPARRSVSTAQQHPLLLLAAALRWPGPTRRLGPLPPLLLASGAESLSRTMMSRATDWQGGEGARKAGNVGRGSSKRGQRGSDQHICRQHQGRHAFTAPGRNSLSCATLHQLQACACLSNARIRTWNVSSTFVLALALVSKNCGLASGGEQPVNLWATSSQAIQQHTMASDGCSIAVLLLQEQSPETQQLRASVPCGCAPCLHLELVRQRLPPAVRNRPLAFIHVALVAHQHLPRHQAVGMVKQQREGS